MNGHVRPAASFPDMAPTSSSNVIHFQSYDGYGHAAGPSPHMPGYNPAPNMSAWASGHPGHGYVIGSPSDKVGFVENISTCQSPSVTVHHRPHVQWQRSQFMPPLPRSQYTPQWPRSPYMPQIGRSQFVSQWPSPTIRPHVPTFDQCLLQTAPAYPLSYTALRPSIQTNARSSVVPTPSSAQPLTDNFKLCPTSLNYSPAHLGRLAQLPPSFIQPTPDSYGSFYGGDNGYNVDMHPLDLSTKHLDQWKNGPVMYCNGLVTEPNTNFSQQNSHVSYQNIRVSPQYSQISTQYSHVSHQSSHISHQSRHISHQSSHISYKNNHVSDQNSHASDQNSQARDHSSHVGDKDSHVINCISSVGELNSNSPGGNQRERVNLTFNLTDTSTSDCNFSDESTEYRVMRFCDCFRGKPDCKECFSENSDYEIGHHLLELADITVKVEDSASQTSLTVDTADTSDRSTGKGKPDCKEYFSQNSDNGIVYPPLKFEDITVKVEDGAAQTSPTVNTTDTGLLKIPDVEERAITLRSDEDLWLAKTDHSQPLRLTLFKTQDKNSSELLDAHTTQLQPSHLSKTVDSCDSLACSGPIVHKLPPVIKRKRSSSKAVSKRSSKAAFIPPKSPRVFTNKKSDKSEEESVLNIGFTHFETGKSKKFKADVCPSKDTVAQDESLPRSDVNTTALPHSGKPTKQKRAKKSVLQSLKRKLLCGNGDVSSPATGGNGALSRDSEKKSTRVTVSKHSPRKDKTNNPKGNISSVKFFGTKVMTSKVMPTIYSNAHSSTLMPAMYDYVPSITYVPQSEKYGPAGVETILPKMNNAPTDIPLSSIYGVPIKNTDVLNIYNNLLPFKY